VLPVLDRYREFVPAGIEIGHDCRDRPIAVAVENIAAITQLEELRIETGIVGPRQ
jgi:hypothetical protein